MISGEPDAQGSSFVPIILGSDKTTVSVATGQNEYYPVYCSIGNVHNKVRRAHRNAVALIAFLAIPKSKCHSVRKWFQIPSVTNIRQPTSATQTAPPSANFGGSYSTPRSDVFCNLCDLGWRSPTSCVAEMDIFGRSYTGSARTLLIILSKRCSHASYRDGAPCK